MYEVFISVFKTSLSCIVIEIPGGRYTPPAVLIMKISIIHVFLPIFVLNGGEPPELYKYITNVLIITS